MSSNRRSLGVSPSVVWTITFVALFGLTFLAAKGKDLPWPNPWKSDVPVSGASAPKAEVLQEEVLDDGLESLEEQLAGLGGTAEPSPAVVAPALSAGNSQPASVGAPRVSEEAAGPPGSDAARVQADARAAASAAALLDEAKMEQAIVDLQSAVSAELAGPAAGGDAAGLEDVPAISDNCVVGSADKCKVRSLDAFFQKLDMIKMGQKARVAAFGDSLIMGDQVVGALRRRLQEQFGSGGPGFLLPAKSARWYEVAGVIVFGSKEWQIHRVTEPRIADALYGFGAQTFIAPGGGATSRVECDSRCPWNDVSEYEIYYLSQKSGGKFTAKVGKEEPLEVNTQGTRVTANYISLKAEAGPLSVSIATVSGPVRLFGLTAENDKAGIVLDSMGILGATVEDMVGMDASHFSEQIAHRRSDLVMLMFGTNESEEPSIDEKTYKETYRKLVAIVRKSNPGVSILMVSPPARGTKTASGVALRPVIKSLVKVQEEVARENGCAFWSAYAAMGGEQGPTLWYNKVPKYLSDDLTHFTADGATHMGKLIYASLLKSYIEYKKR